MTPERWRQIEDLCHETLTRPLDERAAFLAVSCKDDAALLREVQSLLAQEAKAGGFMSVPAAVVAGSGVLHHATGAWVGERFGTYAIRGLLGVGGMGEVYRAYDDTLGREVAIKVLPPAFTSDPERQTRFEREARMLATLNHPHIGAIYSVEEADGVRGLVLELIEGETLAERIARAHGGLPVPDALAIARQISDALDAAHERGIIHRDLKPANIKITPQGVVKVLDFGLAKAASIDGSPVDPAESRHGAIIGTAAYMSPEQARGLSVDRRTDVWAFSCVLYEMLAGHPAFPGDTASDTIVKILEREPDWSALPAATPAPIRRLLLRALTKDQRHRLRDIGDIRIEIDGIDDVLPGISAETKGPAAPAKTRTTWLPWVALVALAAGVAVWETRPQSALETPLAAAHFSRFTDWEGAELAAEISPDGKFVAFMSDAAGEFDIWLKQVGTGSFRNLTEDIGPLNAPGLLRNFGFSGDGAEIWVSTSNDAGGPKILIPLTGGTPRAFLGQGDAAPSWSFDDKRVVYFNNANGDPLFVADRSGSDASRVVAPTVAGERPFFDAGLHNHNPVWSADGRWIYFAHGPDPTNDMDIWRIRPAGGSPERMTQLHSAMNYMTALDARTILFVATATDASGPWLWMLDVDSKRTQRVTTGLEVYRNVSASRDGRRAVATVGEPLAGLWSVPLLDRIANDQDVRRHLSGRALAPRFSGPSLFYLSARGTGDGLWRARNGDVSEIWKSEDGAVSEPAAISPDGSQLAVVVRQEGKRRLLVMSSEGTRARTLAASLEIQGAGAQSSADWSPDGAWIVVGARDAQGVGLFKIPVDGGQPVRLVSGDAISPAWSPNGKLIVYAGKLVAGQVPLLGVTPDGAPVELPAVKAHIGGGQRFLPDSTGVVYLPRNTSQGFWLLDLAGKTTRPLTEFSDQGRLNTFDITPDGKQIVFDRLRESSDIVLIDIPK
jgi:Tol biopolymer transport system component